MAPSEGSQPACALWDPASTVQAQPKPAVPRVPGPQLLDRNRRTVLGKVQCFHWEGTGDRAGAVALKGARLQGGSRQIIGATLGCIF
jgi:hypothetical protein